MNAKQLYDEWTSGEKNGMRPKRVQVVRDDLSEAIGMPIPRRISEIEGWLSTMTESGVITRKLRDAAASVSGQQLEVTDPSDEVEAEPSDAGDVTLEVISEGPGNDLDVDLVDIDGIGPVTQERLDHAGIADAGDLLDADPDELAAGIDGISASQVGDWQAAVRRYNTAEGSDGGND